MHQILSQTLSQYHKIILVGGGTGGHIQPIVSLSKELKNTHDLLWIGGKDSNEESTAITHQIPFFSIHTLKLATTRSPRILLYPLVLIQGILEARNIIKKITGQNNSKIAVFSKGGPGSVAIGIAAWISRIPLYIHESDTVPGRSNRILGFLARQIFLGFESAKKYFHQEKCIPIGQILDPIFSKEKNTPVQEGYIEWKTDKKHILVICGSQGSQAIFHEIWNSYYTDDTCEWIIALGKLNTDMKKDFENIAHIQAIDWLNQENIASLLHDTDLAITRGSATTLAEVDSYGVYKIIIPLPYSAHNHQYYNAREYTKKGDILLEQKDIKILKQTIKNYEQTR